jgi:hypothetical protein
MAAIHNSAERATWPLQTRPVAAERFRADHGSEHLVSLAATRRANGRSVRPRARREVRILAANTERRGRATSAGACASSPKVPLVQLREGTKVDTRRTGRIFGWFFIGTFVTSIPARLLFIDGLDTSWTDTSFTPGAVSDTSLQLGSILEFGVIAFNIANRGRHLPAREATERDRRTRIRHRSHHGVSLHRDRPHQHHRRAGCE